MHMILEISRVQSKMSISAMESPKRVVFFYWGGQNFTGTTPAVLSFIQILQFSMKLMVGTAPFKIDNPKIFTWDRGGIL